MKPYYSDYAAHIIRKHLKDPQKAVGDALMKFSKEDREMLLFVYKVSQITQEGVRLACKVYHIPSEGRMWKTVKMLELEVARNLEILDD